VGVTKPDDSTSPPTAESPSPPEPGDPVNIELWCSEADALLSAGARARLAHRGCEFVYVDGPEDGALVRVEEHEAGSVEVLVDVGVIWEWREHTRMELRVAQDHPWVDAEYDDLVSQWTALGFEEVDSPELADEDPVALLGVFARRCRSSEELARVLESIVPAEMTRMVEPAGEMSLESLAELASHLLGASVSDGVMTMVSTIGRAAVASVTRTYELEHHRLNCTFPFPLAEDGIEAELHSLEFDAAELGFGLELGPSREAPATVTLTSSPQTPVDLYEMMTRAWRVARRSHRQAGGWSA